MISIYGDLHLRRLAAQNTNLRTFQIERGIGLKAYYLFFQIHYSIIIRTSNRTYPRYFKVEFAFNRAKYRAQPRPTDPAKIELQARVIKLRSQGWSFPAIAKHLDISVGTAWNITNANAAVYRDKLNRLE